MSGSTSQSNNIRYLYRFGSAEFDQARFELRIEGQIVDADRRPLELLNLLLEHLGEVLTRDELYETLWQDEDVGEGAIANAVSRLRRHLGKENAAFIVTRPRVGYSFTGKVERIAQSTPTESAVALNVGDPVPGRPDYRLDQLLSVSGNKKREVWLANSVTNSLPHVFKFTLDADGLRQLKREYTLSELLSRAPSTSDTVTRVCGRNFEQPPFFVEYPYAGQDLLNWSENSDNLCNLSREARLELFLDIADTVSAAHDLGVLHKDIKPANILMSESQDGVTPLLTDFGSSHLIQKDILSEHGVSPLGMSVSFDALPSSAGGTLMYLAPEVWAGGSPGIRSDVYALGIMLYQMVIGDLRQGIPSDWRERLGDELLADDIQQATSSAPEERLKSVGELTSRLRNLEERRQVAEEQARKEEDIRLTREALNRSQARRPWLIAASLTLVVGMATSLLMYKNALTAQQEAERQTARAEAINEFCQEEIIQGGNPYAKDQASITDILVSASDRVGEAFKDDPATAGSIFTSLASAFIGLSDLKQAELNIDDALYSYENSKLIDSDKYWAVKLIKSDMLFRNGEIEPGKKLLSQFESTAYFTSRKTPGLMFRYHSSKASLFSFKKDVQSEISHLKKALESGLNAGYSPSSMIEKTRTLSQKLAFIKEYDEARKVLNDLLHSNVEFSEVQKTTIQYSLGIIYSDEERYKEAETILLEVREQFRTLLGITCIELMTLENQLSNIYAATERWHEALSSAQEAYRIAEEILPENNNNRIVSTITYGIQLQNIGRNSEAIEVLKDVYEQLYSMTDGKHAFLYALSYTLTIAHTHLDKYEEARTEFNKIDSDILQKIQPQMDVAHRMKIIGAILDYRQFNDLNQMAYVEQQLPSLEDCSCALLTLARSSLGVSGSMSATTE